MVKSIYNKMWNDALKKIKRNELELDPFINDPGDLRRGITLQAKPDREILDIFNKFLEEAGKIEPEQYYYKQTEMHVTILSIINCSKEFNLSQIFLPDYIRQIESSLSEAQPFEIEFCGITSSPSCILIQGFPKNNSLELIRNRLRAEFAAGDIYNSIDSRYRIETAHCTVIRFIKELKEKQKFIGFLEDYRDYYFGKTFITKLELVYTDWYHKNNIVQVLHKFIL